jgi:hypothetical protein
MAKLTLWHAIMLYLTPVDDRAGVETLEDSGELWQWSLTNSPIILESAAQKGWLN